MSRSHTAIVARGLDTAKATELVAKGWTLGALQQAKDGDLDALGLSADQQKLLRDGTRPPIPQDTVQSLLFANRYQCCVCRDPLKSVIIHHIDEWHVSHSHELSNLVVICLEHHRQAHSRSTLSQNLDAASLKSFKSRWESEVKTLDSRSIIEALKADYAHWAFINELRLFELLQEHGLNFTNNLYYQRAFHDQIVDKSGFPLPVRTDSYYKAEGPAILTRYAYMKDHLHNVIDNVPIINISDHLEKSFVLPVVIPGDFIFIQGAHVFSHMNNNRKGIGQHCRGKRSANGVEVTYTFDRWEATTSSSLNDWLVGTKVAGSLVQVRNVQRSGGQVVLTGTVLAISSFTRSLKTRQYGTYG